MMTIAAPADTHTFATFHRLLRFTFADLKFHFFFELPRLIFTLFSSLSLFDFLRTPSLHSSLWILRRAVHQLNIHQRAINWLRRPFPEHSVFLHLGRSIARAFGEESTLRMCALRLHECSPEHRKHSGRKRSGRRSE